MIEKTKYASTHWTINDLDVLDLPDDFTDEQCHELMKKIEKELLDSIISHGNDMLFILAERALRT